MSYRTHLTAVAARVRLASASVLPFVVFALLWSALLGSPSLAHCAEVQLEWDPVSDPRVDIYEVKWGASSGQYEHTADATSNSAQVSGLQEGETYYVAVRACVQDRTLCSSLSEEVSTTIALLAAPCCLPSIIVAVPPPIASFEASTTSRLAPLTVVFTDTSTGQIDGWRWDFGDGTRSIGSTAVHTYSTAGTYTVSLTVNGAGGSATITKADLVTAP